MKILIFDASTLINLTINGIEEILSKLKKETGVKFIMTSAVKFETIKRPVQIKKYELGALKIKNLLDEGIFESPSELGIDENEVEQETKLIMEFANKIFFSRNQPIHLIDKGEASCLALYNLIKKNRKDDKVAIAVDERTTRMLGEKPENLKKLMENKLHTKIEVKKNYSEFGNYIFIRSCEIVYLAYKKGLIEIKDGTQILDALLYATKFAGCSVSREEIEEMKKL